MKDQSIKTARDKLHIYRTSRERAEERLAYWTAIESRGIVEENGWIVAERITHWTRTREFWQKHEG